MSIADAFRTFLTNIKIDNGGTISLRYGEITAALNKKFRDTESKTANSLQVGSYGRRTAIKGVSDLDMLYIMPVAEWVTYNKNGGQSKLLSDCCQAISDRYPNTTVKVDRLVVRVLYLDFHIEVQPVFEENDGSFTYPDTYNGGSWKTTKPRDELIAMQEFNEKKNNNLRRLARMVRAWKNKHGVVMGGLLIDTLAYNFLNQATLYDDKSYLYYDWMTRDFFKFLADQPKQDRYAALGSGQHVKVKKDFRKQAKKAHELCLKAIEAEKEEYRNDRWRKVFGTEFPPRPSAEAAKAVLKEAGYEAQNTEQFIEDRFRVDIRYDIELECEVTQDGFRPSFLTHLIATHGILRIHKHLRFFITNNTVPAPYTLYWKVLNRGPMAVRRNAIRGQIVKDEGREERRESTDFKGDHIVECYAVKNGVVVAKTRIHVPITA